MKTQTLKKYVTIKIEEEIRNQLRLLAAWQQRPQLAVLRDLVEREVASAGIPVPGSKPFTSPTLPVIQKVRRYPAAAANPPMAFLRQGERDAAAADVQYVSLDEPEAGEFDDN